MKLTVAWLYMATVVVEGPSPISTVKNNVEVVAEESDRALTLTVRRLSGTKPVSVTVTVQVDRPIDGPIRLVGNWSHAALGCSCKPNGKRLDRQSGTGQLMLSAYIPLTGETTTRTYSWEPCAKADIDGDGRIDGADLAAVMAAWGGTSLPCDITRDGIVDGADLLEVLGTWSTL